MTKIKENCNEGVQGATFGIMEAVIMVIGVMLGLSVTGSKTIIILGLITAGLADAFANSSAFHVAQETERHHTQKEVLKSTALCFFATLLTVCLMVLPLFFFTIKQGIVASISIGMLIITGLGIYVSGLNKKFNTKHLVLEYILIAAAASVVCYYIAKIVLYLNRVWPL